VSVESRRAVYGKLAGDSTLTNLLHAPPTGYGQSIYYEQAPDEAQLPYIVFNLQSDVATYAFAPDPAFNDEVWQIKGVARDESADTVDAIKTRVKELLNDATLTISGANHLYLRWQSGVDYSENVDGQRYVHAGALFRLVTD
jgi:hypothetical protein